MSDVINEPISMVASNTAGKITPLSFSWQGFQYDSLTVTSRWPVMEGKYAIRYYSLFDGSKIYKVRLITAQMSWELVSII